MSEFVLPEALMMNVWLALPIKSTARFGCVSKSWCASLSDPQFIYKNLTLFGAAENDDHDHLLVLGCDHECYSVVSHQTIMVATPLQVSPLQDDMNLRCCHVLTYSSCDDLVCFHDKFEWVTGVWNLTTGEIKILPKIWFEFVAFGFGFDDKMQDYKIVLIGYDGKSVDTVVYVYSLRSGNNCWRKLYHPNLRQCSFATKSDDYCCRYRDSYSDGVFYWCNSNDVMVAFDMSSEVFNTFSVLRHPHPLGYIERIRKVKDGSMLLIWCDYDCNNKEEFELWVLLEVGVAQSLTKLFNIDWQCVNKLVSPLGFWRRNELVFHCRNRRLVIGDPSSKQRPAEVRIDEPLLINRCLAWTKGKNSGPLN